MDGSSPLNGNVVGAAEGSSEHKGRVWELRERFGKHRSTASTIAFSGIGRHLHFVICFRFKISKNDLLLKKIITIKIDKKKTIHREVLITLKVR